MFGRKVSTLFLGLSVLVWAGVGCGPDNGSGGDTGSDAGSMDADANGAQNQTSYALASTVLGEDSNTTFVRYLDTLDQGSVSLDNAREYAGYATIGSVGEMFFVASGKEPKVTRFEVGSQGNLTEDGQISFSQYVDEAPLYANTFVDETSAYLENDDTARILWNPTEMRIDRNDELEQIDEKVEGKAAYQGFRRAAVVRGDYVFQPFNWAGPDFYEYASTSKILVYDAETDEVANVIEASCPGLGVGTKDEQGNVYFTNWVSTSAAPVIEGESNSHSPCAVKIDAGETTLNENWTQDLEKMTGGREVTAMRILEGSTAVAAVLDEQKVDADSDTDPQAITYSQNWELWRLDLEAGSGSKIPGTGYIAGGFYAFRLDGRMVVTLPDASYANTTAYEIPVDGEAKELFDTKGWVYQLVELD